MSTSTASEPTADQVTLATIREWAESTERSTTPPRNGSHAHGMRTAARDVLAILAVHGKPPGTPWIAHNSLDDDDTT